MNLQEKLQQWAQDNGVKGVRFFPLNSTESSSEGILDSMDKAIGAIESGRVAPYQDPVTSEK